MSSHSISSDSPPIEATLRDLDPAALDDAFLARLEAAADGLLLTLTPAEITFEKALRIHGPAALSDDFMSRLESVVSGVEFAVNDKIVLFPKTAPLIAKPKARGQRSMWAAAAAVALIGGVTALMLPGRPAPAKFVAKNSAPVSQAAPELRSSNYAPAGFNRGLGEATDEGVAWPQNDKPHRVVRVTYIDKVTLKNAEGKTVVVEQPRTEYIIAPEKMD